MKTIAMFAAALVTGVTAMAQGAVTSVGEQVTDASRIVDGGKYMLKNTGRGTWLTEDAYGSLTMGADPTLGSDASLNYVFTLGRDAEGNITLKTRRGRYIPEVGDGQPSTVSSAAGAGHFVLTPSAKGFTIVNSVDKAHGFDGNETTFVGWNAGEGGNCFYEIYAPEMGLADYPLYFWSEEEGSTPKETQKWLDYEGTVPVWSWASKDVAYKSFQLPELTSVTDTTINAWKGERLGMQALIVTPVATGDLSVTSSQKWAEGAFVRYVLSDDFRQCGTHPMHIPSFATGDIIDRPGSTLSLDRQSIRPVWFTIEVPRNISAGKHTVTFTLTDETTKTRIGDLTLNINVADRTMPLPSEQKFHVDFWQQPYAISRYHGVKPWSSEHFEIMRPYMELLARSGQKVVSAIMFHEPWGDQSHDKFDPMIGTTRKADGTWSFDYGVFDRWVEFMDSCGIREQINCYSMIPWDMSFRYYDEATDGWKFLRAGTDSPEYKDLWTAMLTDFAAHLRGKGWFDKTHIAMDERGLGDMLNAFNLLKETVPDMKMALAGYYHSELADKLEDYCIPYGSDFSSDELKARHAAGLNTTLYTCCTERMPNIFTGSDPVEATFLPINATARGYDGYLHWSLLNWAEKPLTDSRFRLFGSGDTYCLYPGARSSLRFERMMEGVQLAEKAAILQAEGCTGLNDIMERVAKGEFSDTVTPATLVNEMRDAVDKASVKH